VVVPSAAPMRTLTPVLAIDYACKLVVLNEKARVFTLFEITGAQRGVSSHGDMHSMLIPELQPSQKFDLCCRAPAEIKVAEYQQTFHS